MKRKILLIFLLALAAVPSFASTSSYECNEPYNKPLSVFLSVAAPGMGQIYSGQLDKGLAIWGASSLLTASILVTVCDLNFNGVGGFDMVAFGFQLKDELSPSEKFWTWGLSATYVILYVYNVLDISLYNNNAPAVSADFRDGSFHLNYCIKF